MSAEPQDLPPAAEAPPHIAELDAAIERMATTKPVEPPVTGGIQESKEAKVVIRKGQVVTIAGKEFKLEMNAVISGPRADLVAAGLEPL